MEKSFFEQMGGTYHQEGDYFLPDLLPPESIPVGIWGQRRRHYLKTQGLHPTGVQSEPGGSKHGTEKRISAAGQNALPLISFLFGKGVSNLTGGYCWQTPSRGTLRCTRTLPMWV